MTRETLRWPTVFVLIVLITGGGCLAVPFMGQQMEDMSYIGLDEHTHARLRGETNPRPSDPEPVASLSGKLLLYQLKLPREYPSLYGTQFSSLPIQDSDTKQLEQLASIESVGHLALHWEERDQDQDTTEPTEYTNEPTVTPKQFKEALLAGAQVRQGDLILVYTAGDKSDDYDPTLSLVSILTLGFAPTKIVTVDTTVQAALIDARSGYIYAVCAGEGDGWRFSNHWKRAQNKYPAAEDASKEAFNEMVKKLKAAWPAMQQVYQ